MASLPTDPSSKREFYVRDGRRQVTFSCRCEPAASSSDFLASLLASGLVKRHASVTFDPAASSCGMPALLLIQRPRHAACQRHF